MKNKNMKDSKRRRRRRKKLGRRRRRKKRKKRRRRVMERGMLEVRVANMEAGRKATRERQAERQAGREAGRQAESEAGRTKTRVRLASVMTLCDMAILPSTFLFRPFLTPFSFSSSVFIFSFSLLNLPGYLPCR